MRSMDRIIETEGGINVSGGGGIYLELKYIIKSLSHATNPPEEVDW